MIDRFLSIENSNIKLQRSNSQSGSSDNIILHSNFVLFYQFERFQFKYLNYVIVLTFIFNKFRNPIMFLYEYVYQNLHRFEYLSHATIYKFFKYIIIHPCIRVKMYLIGKKNFHCVDCLRMKPKRII